MATGYPVKANYATGDVLTAANMNDLAGTVNFAVSTTPTTATQMAGKNALINGDFGIWARGTSFTSAGYTADRWRMTLGVGNTTTVSQQAFTPGTAPVAGYEGTYFCRYARTVTAANGYFVQRIEDVRTFAGQTVTLSFWAKAGTSFNFAAGDIYLYQYFGSGGSAAVATTLNAATTTIGTSWTRYTFTATLPSVAGKTIGADSYLETTFQFTTFAGNCTFDIWGVQLEVGSSATPFQTATGTKQGELAACQRYYFRNTATGAYTIIGNTGIASSTTQAYIPIQTPVTMRVAPTAVDYSNIAAYNNSVYAVTSLILSSAGNQYSQIQITVASGLTAGAAYSLITNNNSAGYIGFSAEL